MLSKCSSAERKGGVGDREREREKEKEREGGKGKGRGSYLANFMKLS